MNDVESLHEFLDELVPPLARSAPQINWRLVRIVRILINVCKRLDALENQKL
jgi:hypothetical protein